MGVVCLCNNVSAETIVEAIKNGADTFEKVKEATGAGSGWCGAARCRNAIETLIEENN